MGVYIVGLTISYWLNARVVFRDNPDPMSFLKFIFSFCIALTVNLITLSITLNKMQFSYWISQLIAIAAYSSVHFILNRTYVFRWKEVNLVNKF